MIERNINEKSQNIAIIVSVNSVSHMFFLFLDFIPFFLNHAIHRNNFGICYAISSSISPKNFHINHR